MKTVRVKAAPGRRVPIHESVARAGGGEQLFIHGDHEHDLPDVSFVRRRITAGDLIVVEDAPVTKSATLTKGGPPSTFGDAKPFDAASPGPGPNTAAPLAPRKEKP